MLVTKPKYVSSCTKTMPTLDKNLPVKCTKCSKMVVKKNMARHKKSCDSGTLFCPECPHFCTKNREDMNHHIAKHHAPKDTKLSIMCTVCLEEFPSFYSLQQHKRRKHGTSTKVGTKLSEKLKEVLESEELEMDNEQLQQELTSVQHFFDDTEMENGKHQVFNFKLSKLDPHEFGYRIYNKKCGYGQVSILLRSREQHFFREISSTLFQRTLSLSSRQD